MKKYLWLIIAVTLYSCSYKKEYKGSVSVNKYNNNNGCPVKLYREYYCTFSGYQTTDLYAVYLTDSTNFRVNLGEYDTGDQWIDVKCKGDNLYVKMLRVEKYVKTPITVNGKEEGSSHAVEYPPKTLESKAYSLKALKKGWRFW
jgi:hypothetical protein